MVLCLRVSDGITRVMLVVVAVIPIDLVAREQNRVYKRDTYIRKRDAALEERKRTNAE